MASGNSLVLKDARELSSAFAKAGGAVTPERIYALWAGASMTEQEQPDIEFAFIADAACRQAGSWTNFGVVREFPPSRLGTRKRVRHEQKSHGVSR
jgi:hypothetical protein